MKPACLVKTSRSFARTAAIAATSLLMLAAMGCSQKLEGAKPTLEPPSADAAPPPIDPEIVCRDQLRTEVAVHGSRFSPIPIDLPGAPKTALPTLTLSRAHELDGADASTTDLVVYSGDPDADTTNAFDDDGAPLLSWKSQTEMSFIVTQALTLGEGPATNPETRDTGMLAVGVWDVKVQNATGAFAESLGSFAVVDKPELAQPTPGIACLSQGARTIELSGQTFLRNEDDKAVLSVEGVSEPFALELSDCTAIAHEGLDAEVCTSASAELAQGSIDSGFAALTIENPETAACASTEDRKLRVVPPPQVDRVAPPMACLAQDAREVVIEGADFLRIDGSAPSVTIADAAQTVDSMGGCEPLETQGHEVEVCTSITLTLAMAAIEPGLYDVTVQNPQPAGCDSVGTGVLRIVPPPSLDDVQPALVCLDDGARAVTLSGGDFLVVDGEKPLVEVDSEVLDPMAIEAEDCSDLEVDGLSVQTCDTLVLTLAANSVGLGMPEVRVENPQPAGCSDTRSDLLTVVAGPVITSAAPALLCTEDGSKAITLTGTGFLSIDDALPAVQIDGDAVTSVDSIDDCTTVVANGLTVEQCTSLVVTVAQDFLEEGQHEVQVENPGPAGCTATRADALTVPPLLAITMPVPMNVCKGTVDAAFELALTGTGFVTIDGELPTVMFEGTAVTSTASDCTELDVDDGADVSSCARLDLSVDLTATSTMNAGMIPISVENAHLAACDLTAVSALNVVEPPSVTSIDIVGAVSDSEVCSDLALTITIAGAGFVDGATVTLVNEDPGFTVAPTSVTVDSATQITAVFESGLPYNRDDSDFDLVVANAGNCESDPIVDIIDVNPTPLVFFVDPPVVYNDISVDITVFASGLSNDSTLDSIELIDGSGAATELTVVDNTTPTRIVATVPDENPATTMPFVPGDYAIRVTSVLGCSGQLDGGLAITDTLADSLLASIAPSFASPTQSTAVTITGSGFTAIPRVYISSGTGSATPLGAVDLRSATEMTAIVPAGLTPGAYDLIVVNPNGDVDVLVGGLTVTAAEPPIVTSVVPASLPANTSGTITLTGSGFDSAGAEISLDCLLGATRVTVAATGVSVAGDGLSATATIDLAQGLPTDPASGSVCVVRITNADGAFFDYSAFSVTNSSLNLSAWNNYPTTSLNTARRGLALAAGRPTETSRFLYAIGGDTGVTDDPFARGTLLTSVELASVDVFGTMGSWSLQRNDLSGAVIGGSVVSSPRTQAGVARIGRFVYLAGGHNGTSATTTLLRAQVLDPTATPEMTNLDAELGDIESNTGLPGGLYYYRVAAIFASDDASNPGGESLPGELLPVQLPDRDENIVLSLSWNEIDGAHGYRVYRTPIADSAADQLELLGEITCGTLPTDLCDCGTDADQCKLTDDGTVATTSATTPLPTGSLGVWHAVDGADRCEDASCELGTAREGLVTVAVRDRTEVDALTDTYYLYAIGGRDAAGTYLSTIELATVTVTLATNTEPEMQTVTDWISGGDTLSSPRADLGAWVMNAESASVIRSSGSPNDVWVYIGGGRTTGGVFDRDVEASLVGASGTLATLVATDGLNGDLAGLGTGASNGQLYTFGGQTSANGSSASLCAGGGGCGALPDLRPGAFNSLAQAATQRMFMGFTQESAFFFLVGGYSGTTAVATTQRTVQ